ncbi:hypothetical protein SH1V18_29730 [Vallitalea longa]|uniref:Uncharacterized protein n=1 Tax=Vallitalea longa TaxID=2936439 RepID=A0A9W5YFZ2_9FIRM|nr:DUF6715 family protein [Vallitalea longa]GKX30493.1 hypothetical protein SH1V18_29730 [Vallitalea longa]
MRKFIAVLILMILGILLFVTFSNKTSQDRFDKSLLSNSDRLLKNLEEDYDNTVNKLSDLQKAPEQVLELNNEIMQKLYSDDVDDAEIDLLINFQRKLYDDELLANNPIETHLEKIKEEIKNYKENGTKIIGYDTQKNDDNKIDDMFFIKVVYYLNNVGPKGEIYEEYLLVKDQELWKIKGWQKTEEFIVVGD